MTTVHEGEVATSVKIPPDGEKYPVDFNKIDASILLGLGDASSQGINLGTINRTKSYYINIPLTSASANYNNVVLDVYTKRLVTFIDIKPALILSNLCPVPVHFALNCKSLEFTQTVFRSNPTEVFMFDPYKEQTTMQVTVNDTYTTTIELTKFLNKEPKQSLTLTDSKVTGLKIHINLEHNRYLNTITIYSKFNIFNETGLDLEFFSFNPSSPGASHKLVGNGNDTVLFQSQKSHSTFVIKTNPKTFEKVDDFPANLLPSIRGSTFFPKNISYNLNEKITGGSGESFYEYPLAIIPNVVKLQEGILTKTITIAPQYVILNNSPFQLKIIQESANTNTVIASMTRHPLIWRSPEKRISVQVLDQGKE